MSDGDVVMLLVIGHDAQGLGKAKEGISLMQLHVRQKYMRVSWYATFGETNHRSVYDTLVQARNQNDLQMLGKQTQSRLV